MEKNEARVGRRTILSALGLGIASATLPAWSQAKAWKPARPVRLINGFSAGGSADMLCRILAEALRPLLDQTVIVETKAGANGFIAAEAVARAAPDGLTIGLATMSMLAVAPQLPGLKLPINTQTELTPIGSIAGIYSLLVSPPDAPFRTVPDLIAYAKAHPGAISYASAGTGSTPHLAGELFRRQANIDIVHVPYKGGSQALLDLMAGRVNILIGNMPDFLPQVKSGALRAIAFGGERAAPALPDVPLIKNWLPRYNVNNWFGIVGPAHLPESITTALSNALQAALADPSVRNRMIDLGAEVVPGTPAQLQKMIDDERSRWGEVIRAANIRVE
jgi:tripartite-type tricarboxylate transporter receptor subunit TctC